MLTSPRQFLSTRKRFEDLFLFDWRGSIAVVVLGLVVSFLLFGFWWPYWKAADMDLWVVYEAFLRNERLPQEFFDHPAYLSILLTGSWFRLLHAIGLLDIHTLSALPQPAGAEAAWTHAVRAGRILSLAIAVSFVAAFAMLLRILTRDWRVAALAALFVTFSGGLAMQARIMRTELLSAGLVTVALLLLLIAAQRPDIRGRPALLALAACLATLAITNKVQSLVLVIGLPLVVLPFGVAVESANGSWRSRSGWLAAGLLVIGAILLAWPAASLVAFGLSQAETTSVTWRPVLGAFGVYQPFIALWVFLAMLAFAILWRVTAAETVAAVAGVIAGTALGLLALNIAYHPQNVLVVMNPLEQMFHMFTWNDASLMQRGNLIAALFGFLFDGVGEVIARRTFLLHPSSRPTIFLEWLVIAGTVHAYVTGKRKLALQCALLMCFVWGVDTVGSLRGLKLEYFILTDPVVVIAAAWLLSYSPEWKDHRLAYPVGAGLIALHLIISHAPPVKQTFSSRKPMVLCAPYMYFTKRIETYSYCLPARSDAGPGRHASVEKTLW